MLHTGIPFTLVPSRINSNRWITLSCDTSHAHSPCRMGILLFPSRLGLTAPPASLFLGGRPYQGSLFLDVLLDQPQRGPSSRSVGGRRVKSGSCFLRHSSCGEDCAGCVFPPRDTAPLKVAHSVWFSVLASSNHGLPAPLMPSGGNRQPRRHSGPGTLQHSLGFPGK